VVRNAEVAASAIPILCVLGTVLAQVLYAGYNPWQEPISSLVWGPYGSIQTAAFYLLGASVLILAIKLFAKAKTINLKVGVILLGLVGVGMVMIGIFPAARTGFPNTIINAIHLNVSSVLFCLFPVVCFVLAPKLKECFSHRWVTIYTWAAGILGIVLIAITGGLHYSNLGWIGTMERLVLLNGLVWVQTVTILTLKNNNKKRPLTAGELQTIKKEEIKPRRASTILKTAALTAVCALVLFPAIQSVLQFHQK
jgi:hypothetical membrane protein